jgi:hypothetical protein
MDIPAHPRRVRLKIPLHRSPSFAWKGEDTPVRSDSNVEVRVFEWSGTDDGVLHYQERPAA